MKKLQTALHYLVLILILAVIIFSGAYMYNKSNIQDETQSFVNKSNTFQNEMIKIKKDMADGKKSEVTKAKIEVKKITKVAKPKPKQKSQIKKTIKSKPQIKSKQKPIAKKTYNGENLYFKNCKLCHGDLKIFTITTNKDRLNKLFAQNAKELSSIHGQSNVSKMTDRYFKTKEYKLQIESIGKYITTFKKRTKNE